MKVKKHVDQMTEWEKGYIEHIVLKKAKVIGFSKHCEERMQERNIKVNVKDIAQEVKFENLIHMENEEGKMKFLLRGTKVYNDKKKGKSNLVFVLGYNFKVVSVWFNNINDKHATIDMNQYNENINVKKMYTGWAK